MSSVSLHKEVCPKCGREQIAPYPLLFHKMGIRDIQIGYKISPFNAEFLSFTPLVIAMKKVLKDTGHESKDISEYYDNEDEFVNRVKNFIA